MERFISRQPIFNRRRELFAYELLYPGAETSDLTDLFLTEGIEKIGGMQPCFINFTSDLLTRNVPSSFPKSLIVFEILADAPPAKDVLVTCARLRDEGYAIALDNFVYDNKLEPLIALADIIKFDIRLTPLDTLHRYLDTLSRHKLKFLAEKVETYDELILAKKLGFSFFQGNFFCKPEKILVRQVESAKTYLVNLLAEVSRKSNTIKKSAQIIERDIALSHKLMRYVISSASFRISKMDSIGQAIAHLGEKNLRRYIFLVLISELSADKPSELLRLALVRAEMCRLLAEEANRQDQEDELFLLGLFSLLDAMLDTSIDFICEQLSLSTHLTDGLVNHAGPYGPFLDLVVNYERGNRVICHEYLKKLHIAPERACPVYLEAIQFTRSVLDG